MINKARKLRALLMALKPKQCSINCHFTQQNLTECVPHCYLFFI